MNLKGVITGEGERGLCGMESFREAQPNWQV